MADRDLIAEEILRRFRDDDNVCASPFERAMAAELLDARARIAELEESARDAGATTRAELDIARAQLVQMKRAWSDRGHELESFRNHVVDLERQLRDGRAHIAELEQQSKESERFDALIRVLEWRCQVTTTLGDLVDPADHRAFWCALPRGHAGKHHGELPQRIPAESEFRTAEPVTIDWWGAGEGGEPDAGQSLGYVVVLKDKAGDLTCLASVFSPDQARTAEGIGSGYASHGEQYLIAELREVSSHG